MDESIDVEALNKFRSGKQKLHQKKPMFMHITKLYFFPHLGLPLPDQFLWMLIGEIF